MNQSKIPPHQQKRLDRVLNYIVRNVAGDLSLEKLASISNYSSFHFQKLFKLVLGQTPKQYVLMLRLESSIHQLIIHPERSVYEISVDCGFSSPAVFSRAFRNHFGTSPLEVRSLPPSKQQAFRKKLRFKFPHEEGGMRSRNKEKLNVEVKKLDPIKGIYLLAPFDNMKLIQHSFRETVKQAKVYELFSEDVQMYGLISPHQGNVYMTLVTVNRAMEIPSKLFSAEIKQGRYAIMRIKGGLENTLKAGKYFFHEWLPESGYKVTSHLVFERFNGDPARKDYAKLQREICIPVEPAG